MTKPAGGSVKGTARTPPLFSTANSAGGDVAARCVAFEVLELASDGVLCSADVPAHHINNERTLADSTA